MIQRLLIANRGEIACRIIRTCHSLGIRTVAVYSDADASARHVQMADEAIRLGPAPASESYLSIPAILHAAQRAGVDAIHPGVGFLAEDAGFATACVEAGLIFIGPPAEVIAMLGDKQEAKRHMAEAGIPVLPGYGGAEQSDETMQREAERIGWPLMVKAAVGGGGKGMRLVQRAEELPAALASARREAKQAFGSDALLLEKALLRPRHIEVQIFGDKHGNIVHLGERECSIQRRHQKIIEETPAPGLSAELRERLCTTAVAAGRAVGYESAGTVEFLLDQEGNFYFLEMNTRLQVEHPVTEMVTRLDLVAWQICVAEGEPLPLTQEEISPRGHAVEARLYAENPAKEFLPTTGQLLLWREPTGEGIRVDSGIQRGDEVSIYYDPLLAKLIAHGPDRATATRRLSRALEQSTLLGLTSNLSHLLAILRHPAYLAGNLSTDFLSEHLPEWAPSEEALPLALLAASVGQWHAAGPGHWRNNPNMPQRYRYQLPNHPTSVEVLLTPLTDNRYQITFVPPLPVWGEGAARSAGGEGTGEATPEGEHDLWLTVDGYRRRVTLAQQGETWWVQVVDNVFSLQALPRLAPPGARADVGGSLRAPMPGTIVAILVAEGQRVAKGEPLLKLEAMKMEYTIRTVAPGVVEHLYFAVGDIVEADTLLVKIAELE